MKNNIYLSTTRMAQEHGLTSIALFTYLIEQNFIFRFSGNYRLNKKGFEAGGKYHQNENGQRWIVWHRFIFTQYVCRESSEKVADYNESNKGRYLVDYSPESWLSKY